MDIANAAILSSASSNPIELHISLYVTCLCNPEAIPTIPNCDITISRPSIFRVLTDLTATPDQRNLKVPTVSTDQIVAESKSKATAATFEEQDDEEVVDSEIGGTVKSRLSQIEDGGGVAVCTSGPEGLIREASNAVARLQMSRRGGQLGKIDLHTEVFKL